jgi:hypothetical protein
VNKLLTYAVLLDSWVSVSYIFIVLEINILYRNICVLYINVYILYIQYTYTLQVCMFTNGIVIHYIGWGCQSHNPRKYTVLNGTIVFDVHNIFQEHNLGIKWHPPQYMFCVYKMWMLVHNFIIIGQLRINKGFILWQSFLREFWGSCISDDTVSNLLCSSMLPYPFLVQYLPYLVSSFCL